MRIKKRLLPQFKLDGTPYNSEGFHLVHGKGGGSTTTVTEADPWEPTQPYLRDVLRRGRDMADGQPDYYPTTNPIAGLSEETRSGMDTLSTRQAIDNTMDNAANTSIGSLVDAQTSTTYDNFGGATTAAGNYAENLINTGANADANAATEVANGINTARSNITNYNADTARATDGSAAINSVLNGAEDPRMAAYMEASNNQIADNVMRNNLMPNQVQALAGGSYGGSGTNATRRNAATDMATQIGMNSNKLILDQQNQKLQAAQLAGQADTNASTVDQSIYNSGLNTATTEGALAQTDVTNALAGGEQAIGATQFADELALDAAGKSSLALPTLGTIPFNEANRDIAVGGVYDTRSQAAVDAEIARQLYDNGADNRQLTDYANLVNSVAGTGSTTTSTGPDAPSGGGVAGALGGAATAAGLVSATGIGMTAGTAATATTAATAAALGPVGWSVIAAGALLGADVL